MTADEVRTLRKRLHLSQRAFASRYHIPYDALRDWELGRREITGASLTLLRLIAAEADLIARILED